jgi:RNA polymerase sigma factor (sigma-70 family)
MNEKEREHKFRVIIERHKGILFKVARMYCRYDDERQDLVQEIRIQVWKSFDKYNDNFKLSTWLYRISLNVAISYYRKNANQKEKTIPLNEQIVSEDEIEIGEKKEQLNLLEKFIDELNDIDKALMLLYLEEKSHDEISDILGISRSNVGTKIGRIKEKLKKRFSEIN